MPVRLRLARSYRRSQVGGHRVDLSKDRDNTTLLGIDVRILLFAL